MTSALGFLALCELLGLAALPLATAAFARPAAAVAVAKPLGLLAVGWLAWLIGSVGMGSGIGAVAVAYMGVAVGGTLALLRREPRAGLPGADTEPPPPPAATAPPVPHVLEALRGVVRSRAFWIAEGVFLVSFTVMALVIAHAPDVWGTEKPMDMALINALAEGPAFPPNNPWLAGAELDGYYYLGHWLAALLVMVTGVEPTVGYNLALAAFFAVAASAAYGLGAALAGSAGRRPAIGGLALTGVVLGAGNLAAARELARHDGPLTQFAWFQASRVVPDTINEFPAFSWLLGDLHAHLLAVPFTLVALAFGLQWLRDGPRTYGVGVAAVVCGCLYAISSWSYPVTCGLLVLAIAASPGTWRERTLHGALLIGVGLLAILPFLLHFDAPASGLELVGNRRTLAETGRDAALTVGLALWLVAAAYLAVAVSRPPGIVVIVAGLTALAVTVGAVSGLRLGWAALLLAGAAIAAWQLLRTRRTPPEAFVWLSAFGGFTCLLLAELVFVRDAFAGTPLERMNTVFKLGYQAWLLLGIAGVGAFMVFLPALPRGLRVTWATGAAALAVASAAFPLAGSYARTNGFAGPPRLEGLGWLAASAPGDVAAIAWLRRHADDDAVVLESAGDDYSPAGHARISTFSGRPTVVGWAGHVLQWGEDPGSRRADVTQLYRATDAAGARLLLESYDVDYVVVGPLERSDHGTSGESKWDELGTRVFERAGTTIWRIR